MSTIQRKRVILAAAVLPQYSRVTNDDRQHLAATAELCNAIVTFSQKLSKSAVYQQRLTQQFKVTTVQEIDQQQNDNDVTISIYYYFVLNCRSYSMTIHAVARIDSLYSVHVMFDLSLLCIVIISSYHRHLFDTQLCLIILFYFILFCYFILRSCL